MTVGPWTLLPFATSLFFAAMLHCQSYSDEQSSNGLSCSPICKDDDSLKGETFHCVLSNEGNDYKFVVRNPEEGRWRFYRTDLDSDSSLLCQMGVNGDKFAGNKSRRKCSSFRKSRDTYDYIDSDFIPNIMKEILASKNSGQSGSSVPSSRKSNLAVSASGPGSFAQASDGKESIFASGNKKPSAQTSGNAHAFSSDGKTNAESHFGEDFTYPATGQPGGRPKDDSIPPFFNPFQQQQPSFPVFGNGLPPKKPGSPDSPQPSPGQNLLPFDNVFGSVGLTNPFLMLSGQQPTYSGKRNLRQGQNPRLYKPPSTDSLFPMNIPPEYAVAFLPYMNPYIPPYEAPRRFRTCYPRCKREAIDSASEDDKSEDYSSNLDTELSNEICIKTEREVCRKKKIMYCKGDEACCWEDVDIDKCDDGQIELPTECYKRLSTIFGL